MVVLKLVDLNEKIVDSWFLKYTPANDMSLNPDPVLELIFNRLCEGTALPVPKFYNSPIWGANQSQTDVRKFCVS